MLGSRWRAAFVFFVAAFIIVGGPAGVGAAGEPLRPQQGPLTPAFVEALHDPLAGAFGKLPNPVEVHLGAAAEARAARHALPPAYDLRALGRLTVVKDQGAYGTCWAFANLAAVESRLLPGQPETSAKTTSSRAAATDPSQRGSYSWGGWDFMAVAYLTRWAGPVNETRRSRTTRPRRQRPTPPASTCRA